MLAAALLASVLVAPLARVDESSLTEELLASGESTDSARFAELARFGTPEALAGLLALKEELQSVYMRREVLRAIALLLEPEGTRPAAVKILKEAVRDELEPELRETAVDALARIAEGRQALSNLATDEELRLEIRLEALHGFVRLASAEDAELLERLSGPGHGRSDEFRAAAFVAALPWSSNDALHKSTRHELSAIRIAALEAMQERGDKRTDDSARRMYEDRDAPGQERLIAFRVWLSGGSGRDARHELEEALDRPVPEGLALGIAEALGGLADPAVERSITRLLKDADDHERRILLRAGRASSDAAVAEAFVAALSSPDPRLVREAVDGIAARHQQDASDELESMLEEDREGWLGSVAIDALAALHPDDEWTARFVKLTRDGRSPVRHAALLALRARVGPEVERARITALQHEDWSTRLAALRELELRATPEAVGALCQRIPLEDGRPQYELAAALWRLTGEGFGTNGRAWAAWWEEHGATFRVLTPAELAQRAAEREERILRRTTSASFVGGDGETRSVGELTRDEAFFGVEVVSRHVVFAIDVSASMDERLETSLDKERIRTRLDLALREMDRLLAVLHPKTRFRLITMAGRVGVWSEELRTATTEDVASAREFVSALASAPSTNFYDTLRLAFADPTIDTIYLLSDGEPTAGDVQDPSALRAIVEEWNRHRGIVLHCISIGRELELLQGLARDSGGVYLHFR